MADAKAPGWTLNLVLGGDKTAFKLKPTTKFIRVKQAFAAKKVQPCGAAAVESVCAVTLAARPRFTRLRSSAPDLGYCAIIASCGSQGQPADTFRFLVDGRRVEDDDTPEKVRTQRRSVCAHESNTATVAYTASPLRLAIALAAGDERRRPGRCGDEPRGRRQAVNRDWF